MENTGFYILSGELLFDVQQGFPNIALKQLNLTRRKHSFTGSGTNGSGTASECGTVIERSCLAIGDFTLKNHEISEEGSVK